MKNTIILSFTFLFIVNFSFAQLLEENNIITSTQTIRDVHSGDLDGDGDIDIVFVDGEKDFITWSENVDGAGLMAAPKIIDTNFEEADAIWVADIDGDNDMDLVAIARSPNILSQIVWYPNEDGNGNFGAKKIIHQQSDIFITSGKWKLEVGDMDGDMDMDIVIGYDATDLLAWIENFDGLGNFLPPVVIFQEDDRDVVDLTLGDMDNDDDLDIIVNIRKQPAFRDSLFWYENNTGDFTERHFFYTMTNQKIVELNVLDADNDDDLDIVTLAVFNESFQVFENLGNGVMASPVSLNSGPLDPETFFFGDIDADNDDDLVFFDSSDGKLITLENTNNPSFFENPQTYQTLIGNSPSGTIYTADLNNDEAVEIITVSRSYGYAFTYKNDGNGNIVEETMLSGQFDSQRYFAFGDFDGDNLPDVVGRLRNSYLVWLKNLGNQFSTPQFITKEIDEPRSSHAVDLNLDGFLDLVVQSGTDGPIAWLPNDGAGNFGTHQVIEPSAVDDFNHEFKFGDFDNDQDQDILIKKNSGIYWKENLDGFGSFGTPILISDVFTSSELIIIDMDGDSDLDILTSRWLDHQVEWFENEDGLGTFSTVNLIIDNVSDGPRTFCGGDFDVDGDIDLAVGFSLDDRVYAFFNEGGSTVNFPENQLIAGGFNNVDIPDQVRCFDVDYDGLQDIIYISDTNFSWHRNLGNGSFSDQNVILDGNKSSNFAILDMDLDGDKDIITNGWPGLSWFENIALNPTITGSHFFDENESGAKDADEPLLFNNPLRLDPISLFAYPDENGFQKFAVNNGSYFLQTESPENWALTTDSLEYYIEINGVSIEKQFGWTPTADITKFQTSITSGPTRCDQEIPFWIGYTNTGTTKSSAWLQFEVDDLTTFLSAEPSPDSIEGNFHYWALEELAPTHSGNIALFLEMPDANSVGDFIDFPYKTTVFNVDFVPIFEEIDTLSSEIRCAYDPNDKQVYPNRGAPLYEINPGEVLEYTIRFQNTGNDTAYNVFIKDQLDENLNWASFKPLHSSHPVESFVDENGLITFRFINIFLPDSLTNPISSQGFVKYSIEMANGLNNHTIIENTAQIIFDTNPAIVTNTTQNTLIKNIDNSNEEENPKLKVKYGPNPFSEAVFFEIEIEENIPNLNLEFELFNNLGQKIRHLSIGSNKNWILDSKDLNNGIFFFRLKNKENGSIFSTGKISHFYQK